MCFAGYFLTGCQKPATNTEVQGIWVPDKSSLALVKGTNICEIVLRADGSFAASVPDYLLKTFDQCSGQVMSGKGGWSLDPPRAMAPRQIKLEFTDVDGERINWSSNRLQAEGTKDRVRLFFYIGEEGGKRFVFERAPTQPSLHGAEN
jgi:hypothetical protein